MPMPKSIEKYHLEEREFFRICKLEEKLSPEFFTSHTHSYFEMIIFTSCKSQDLYHSIDFVTYPIVKNRLYFIAEHQVHAWLLSSYDKEFEGYFITFDPAFIKGEKMLLKLFDILTHDPFVDLSTTQMQIPLTLIEMLQVKTINKNYLQSLLEALLYNVTDKRVKSNLTLNSAQQRFIMLRKLIEKHYKREKHVAFYAKKMGISPKRLNESIQGSTSQSVTQLIHQRLMLEAKRELSKETKTVQEIASELGFHDPSYFSRFFKRLEGIPPLSFMGK